MEIRGNYVRFSEEDVRTTGFPNTFIATAESIITQIDLIKAEREELEQDLDNLDPGELSMLPELNERLLANATKAAFMRIIAVKADYKVPKLPRFVGDFLKLTQ